MVVMIFKNLFLKTLGIKHKLVSSNLEAPFLQVSMVVLVDEFIQSLCSVKVQS